MSPPPKKQIPGSNNTDKLKQKVTEIKDTSMTWHILKHNFLAQTVCLDSFTVRKVCINTKMTFISQTLPHNLYNRNQCIV